MNFKCSESADKDLEEADGVRRWHQMWACGHTIQKDWEQLATQY